MKLHNLSCFNVGFEEYTFYLSVLVRSVFDYPVSGLRVAKHGDGWRAAVLDQFGRERGCRNCRTKMGAMNAAQDYLDELCPDKPVKPGLFWP